MQAILTKYISATNFRGSRIKASCDRGSITISYQHDLSSEEEGHKYAVDLLIARFVKEDAARYGTERNPWTKARVCGQLASGDYVHVFADPANQVVLQFRDNDDLTAFRHYHEAAVSTEGTVTGLKCGLMCSALKRSTI